MKEIKFTRKTKETNIEIHLSFKPKGKYAIKTPINFLNHLLENFAKHGNFQIAVSAEGDVKVDHHHLCEDLGICLGKTFKTYLQGLKSYNRTGFFAFPMDESLGIVAVDLSGRPHNAFKAKFRKGKIGDLKSDCIKEFFSGFSLGAGCNIAVLIPYGENEHHKAEALFKSFGKALEMAISNDSNLIQDIPSTKGVIDKF